MLRLRDIMATQVVTVTPETSVRDAMELLGRSHLSGVPVVVAGQLVGVVSTTDLLSFVSGLSGVPTQSDMANDWLIPEEDSLDEDVESEDEPGSAYFSDLWDDAGAEVSSRVENVDGPEWNTLDEHDVSELMTRLPLVTLSPDADVETAAQLMKDRAIHRVLVTDGDALVGVVSALDIAKAVADHRIVKHVFVFNHDADFQDIE